MNDQELLELAAKAAGYWWRGMSADGQPMLNHNPKDTSKNRIVCPCPWNPLEDDGDALRLAVMVSQKKALRLMLPEYHDGWAVVDDYTSDFKIRDCIEYDPYAATRRAIVKAAAEIGKGMA